MSAPFRFETNDFQIAVVFNFEGFANSVDMVSLHTDNFFGLPWDEFKPGGQRVEPWHAVMDQIKLSVEQLNTGVYLSLTPLNGFRNGVAAKAVDKDGAVDIQPGWVPGCYDFDVDPEHIREVFLNFPYSRALQRKTCGVTEARETAALVTGPV